MGHKVSSRLASLNDFTRKQFGGPITGGTTPFLTMFTLQNISELTRTSQHFPSSSGSPCSQAFTDMDDLSQTQAFRHLDDKLVCNEFKPYSIKDVGYSVESSRDVIKFDFSWHLEAHMEFIL